MFRIGFDPMLEASQRQAEIIREMALVRMATGREETGRQKNAGSYRFLAWLGRGLASIGAYLEAHYGEQLESAVGLDQRRMSGGCA